MITFALPTGRSLQDCITILEGSGLPVERLRDPGRNLVIEEGNMRYMLSKPSDIPAIAYYGAADLALIGCDVTAESGISLAELLDTGYGKCVMAVAGPEEAAAKFARGARGIMGLRVATKYVRIAEQTFENWGAQVKILKLNGSVELAPALGLGDCIFDIVQTGRTLKANGLSVIKETMPVSLRLVSGPGTVQTKWRNIFGVLGAMRNYIKNGGGAAQ